MDEASTTWSKLALPAAVAMTALSAGLLVAWLALAVTMPAAVPSDDTSGQLFLALPIVAMGAIAFLLAARRPENPVGWLLGAAVITLTLLLVGSDYGDHWLYVRDLPTALVAPLSLIGGLGWTAGFTTLLVLIPMVFPDGRLLSRRWRPLMWAAAASSAIALVASSLDPEAIGDGHRYVANPIGVPGAHDVLNLISSGVYSVGGVALMAAGVASLGIRYRRADAGLRQQLKWFIAAVTAGVATLVLGLATNFAPASFFAISIGFTALPVSIGIAVFRYRLYDIGDQPYRALRHHGGVHHRRL